MASITKRTSISPQKAATFIEFNADSLPLPVEVSRELLTKRSFYQLNWARYYL